MSTTPNVPECEYARHVGGSLFVCVEPDGGGAVDHFHYLRNVTEIEIEMTPTLLDRLNTFAVCLSILGTLVLGGVLLGAWFGVIQ